MVRTNNDYLDKLRRRAKESHVYKKYQLIGLEISQILNDEKHKSLYIKLAKEKGDNLLCVAKEVAEKKNVKNRGAYFMAVLTKVRNDTKIRNNAKQHNYN